MSPKWIDASAKAKKWLREAQFSLDDHAAERRWNFKLSQSLERARKAKVLNGVRVYITPHTIPDPPTLKSMIQRAGGVVLDKAPRTKSAIVIGSLKDSDACQTFHAAGLSIYTEEFILLGILKQELNYESDRLFP